MCLALHQFLSFQGRWDELLALSARAEAKAVAGADHDNAVWRAFDAGWVHYLRQQADAVLACADRAAEHQAMGKAGARERAVAIRLRGMGHQLKKYYAAAIVTFREALDLSRAAEDSRDVMASLNDLADAENQSGDFTASEGHLRETLRLARASDHAEGVAACSGNLAALALAREDWPAAETQAREALALSEAVHRQDLVAEDNHRLAKALVGQSRTAEALAHARRAVEIFTLLGSPDLARAQATLAECED